MAVTFGAADVKAYVGAATDDDDYCADVAVETIALIGEYLGTDSTGTLDFHNCSKPVPDPVLARAYKELAAELYNRRDTKNGVSQFADLAGAGIRIARDPMVAVRPLLSAYLAGGFA